MVKDFIPCQVNIPAHLEWWDVSLFDFIHSTCKYGVLTKCQLLLEVQKSVLDKAGYKGV